MSITHIRKIVEFYECFFGGSEKNKIDQFNR